VAISVNHEALTFLGTSVKFRGMPEAGMEVTGTVVGHVSDASVIGSFCAICAIRLLLAENDLVVISSIFPKKIDVLLQSCSRRKERRSWLEKTINGNQGSSISG
jgi:hypothetical protein